MKPLKDSAWVAARYFWNILIGIDQLFNAILAGDPDETMSSRFAKWLRLPHDTWRWKIAHAVCRVLHVFDEYHCDESIEEDEGDNAVARKTKK